MGSVVASLSGMWTSLGFAASSALGVPVPLGRVRIVAVVPVGCYAVVCGRRLRMSPAWGLALRPGRRPHLEGIP